MLRILQNSQLNPNKKDHEKTQDKPTSSKHLKFVKGNHEEDNVYITENK